MPYTLNRYQLVIDPDGRFPLILPDESVSASAASVRFVGKGYPTYGEIFAENWLWLTENFAGTGSPANPLTGQIWFDTSTNSLKVYNTGNWHYVTTNTDALLRTGGSLSGTIISNPSNPNAPALSLHDGTLTNPSLNFNSSTNTGLFLNTTGHMCVTVDGATIASFTNTAEDATLIVQGVRAIRIPTGTSVQRPTTPTNGMLRVNTTIGGPELYYNSVWTPLAPPASGYVNRAGDIMTGNLLMQSGTVTPAQIRLENGTVAAPGLTFVSSPNTGFVYGGSSDIVISNNGTGKWLFNNTGLLPITDDTNNIGSLLNRISNIYSNRLFVSDSTPSNPGYTFDNDLNSGLYKNSTTGRIELAYAGSSKLSIGTFASQSDVIMNGTASLTVPIGTTSQRPSIPTAGMMRFNSTTSVFESHNGTSWNSYNPLGLASASVLFNGTTFSIVSAYNVTSVAYVSNKYVITFTNPMPDANYIVLPVVQDTGGVIMVPSVLSAGKTASSVQLEVRNSSNAIVQPGFINLVIFSTS